MSKTVTARKQRVVFFTGKLAETTLYIMQLIRDLYQSTADRLPDTTKTRDIIIALRDDSDASERFRQALTRRYPHFETVMQHAVTAHIKLMYFDDDDETKQHIQRQQHLSAINHVFYAMLQLYYTMPVLLEPDDKFGTQFIRVRDYWPTIIDGMVDVINVNNSFATLSIDDSNNNTTTTMADDDEEDDNATIFSGVKTLTQPMRINV